MKKKKSKISSKDLLSMCSRADARHTDQLLVEILKEMQFRDEFGFHNLGNIPRLIMKWMENETKRMVYATKKISYEELFNPVVSNKLKSDTSDAVVLKTYRKQGIKERENEQKSGIPYFRKDKNEKT